MRVLAHRERAEQAHVRPAALALEAGRRDRGRVGKGRLDAIARGGVVRELLGRACRQRRPKHLLPLDDLGRLVG